MKIPILLSSCFLPVTLLLAADVPAARLKQFGALPMQMESPKNPITPAKVELGRMLYFEKRLSKAHDISCNSCHNLATFGVDNQPTSPGHKGQRGDRNSPTVFNAAGHRAQFWDARAPDVEEQAKGPMMNPVEMAMPGEKEVVAVLKSIPEYVAAFRKAYPQDKDPVTLDNAAKAIGAFERKLVTPDRWDRFQKGDTGSLSPAERGGFNRFVEVGCGTCHNGPYLGGMDVYKLGNAKAWPDKKDVGRFNVTKREGDKYMFKAPSLRNIEKTGPYFHDGKVASLEEAVRLMAEYQLGKKLSAGDVTAVTSFLKALTGTPPAPLLKPPKMPASTPATPKPVKAD